MRLILAAALLPATMALAMAPASPCLRLDLGGGAERCASVAMYDRPRKTRGVAGGSRPRQRPPPTGTPAPFAVFQKWALVQLSSDAASLTALCIVTRMTPLQLYTEQVELFWFLLGPALVTFGAVWARIVQTDAAERYGEDDFIIQKLGGPDSVQSLRYAISESLRF